MEDTARYWRYQARQGILIGETDPYTQVNGRFYQGPAGRFRNITVQPDGTIVISPKAYADDVVAFVSAAISTNPNISQTLKDFLIDFIDDMDMRAVKRHGYSHNLDEASVNWVPAHPIQYFEPEKVTLRTSRGTEEITLE
jgi:hypothetical protein